MKYLDKVNKLKKDFIEQYKRRDETFEMMSIKGMLKELEAGETDYSKEECEIISKYLCEKYFKCMSKWKETLEERKKQNIIYY